MSTKIRCFLTTVLLLSLASSTHAMAARKAPPLAGMQFVRANYEPNAAAIVIEWVVPSIDALGPLARIELLILDAHGKPVFGVLQNRSARCNPIPPDTFGVIVDPASDDRSIKNVASAGFNVQWNQASPYGILLKQSAAGVIGGNLGISVWIAPRDWNPGRYVIKTRAVTRDHSPAPWQELAEFDYTGAGVEKVTESRCLVKPIFFNVSHQSVMPFDHVGSVVLIRYERQKQDKGVVVKRWPDDASSQYKYVEKERQELKLRDLSGGFMSLVPGIYQFKHNSVHEQPPSGFYGESNFFEIKTGEETVEVQILLNPAI